MTNKTPSILIALTIGAFLVSAGRATAEDNWTIEPSIKESGTWQSNPLLQSGKHESLYGSITTPQIAVTSNTPTTAFNAMASMDYSVFNQSSFNSTDFHGDVNLDRKMQQWEASLTAHSDYDTTRTSELTTLNQSAVGSVRHMGNTISPELSFRPSESDKISLAGSYNDSRYDSSLLSDYHIAAITPSYQYDLNQLNSVVLSLPVQRYESNGLGSTRTDSVTPTAGWTGSLTPNLSAKANAGLSGYQDNGSFVSDGNWKWTPVYSAELAYKSENDVANLSGRRDLEPYVNGRESYLNTLAVSDQHKLNELLATTVGASYHFAGSDNKITGSLRSLVGADAGLIYHATERFDVDADYHFRNQELFNTPGSQSDNQFMVSLVYRPVLSVFDQNK